MRVIENRAKVLIMAAGTGGHIFPGLAVARKLTEKDIEVAWLGTPAGLENQLLSETEYPLYRIDIRGLRGKGIKGWLLAPLRVFQAMRQANKIINEVAPSVVLSMGGYVAGPGGLVARWRGIPLLIHEQNRVPGLTNNLLSRFATTIFQGFPDSFPKSKGALTAGNPVRQSIIDIPDPQQRLQARSGALRILVLGGSQGAESLNRLLPAAIAGLPSEQPVIVRHQAGKGRAGDTRDRYITGSITAEVSDFIADMAAAYSWADLVVCRAGALTVAEVAATGLAALFIPYPAAVDDHQTRNAEYLAAVDAARILQEAGLDAQNLCQQLMGITGNREKLYQMAINGRKMALPGAAEVVAERCRELSA